MTGIINELINFSKQSDFKEKTPSLYQKSITKYGIYKLKIVSAYLRDDVYKSLILVLKNSEFLISLKLKQFTPTGRKSRQKELINDLLSLNDTLFITPQKSTAYKITYENADKYLMPFESKNVLIELENKEFYFEIMPFFANQENGVSKIFYKVLNIFKGDTMQSAKEFEENIIANLIHLERKRVAEFK